MAEQAQDAEGDPKRDRAESRGDASGKRLLWNGEVATSRKKKLDQNEAYIRLVVGYSRPLSPLSCLILTRTQRRTTPYWLLVFVSGSRSGGVASASIQVHRSRARWQGSNERDIARVSPEAGLLSLDAIFRVISKTTNMDPESGRNQITLTLKKVLKVWRVPAGYFLGSIFWFRVVPVHDRFTRGTASQTPSGTEKLQPARSFRPILHLVVCTGWRTIL